MKLRTHCEKPGHPRHRNALHEIFFAVLFVTLVLGALLLLQFALILTHTPVHLPEPRKAAPDAWKPMYTPAKK